MTPAARLSAAIQVLDAILAGQNADAALTAWGRASRFAGSGDRYGVRDLVFGALRCKRSFAALGGSSTGRGLILGGLRAAGAGNAEIDALFCGLGHAPSLIGPADQQRSPSAAEAMDLPDWLIGPLDQSLGPDLAAYAAALQSRAPVYLRCNPARATRAKTMQVLAENGVKTHVMQNLNFGLQVTEGDRKIAALKAFSEGWFELQDASSQAVIEALDMPKSGRILDYCAGGGGKTLSIAAQCHDSNYISIFAHDFNTRRMADLLGRAQRNAVQVTILENAAKSAPYDLILTDVPCSGSGSWRRDPQGKWALTAPRLAELCAIQAQILDSVTALLAQGGQIAYTTCSVLNCENEAQISAALHRHPHLHCVQMQRFGLTGSASGTKGGDGFFLAVLVQKTL